MSQQPTWGLGRFEYLAFLGRGGMGSVYEVFDRELGARVALKTVGFVDGQTLLRFKREFRSIRELHHPNIVRLHELLEFEGSWGYTMELVQGVDFVHHVLGRAACRGTARAQGSSGVEERGRPEVVSRVAGGDVPTFGALAEARLRPALLQLAEAIAFLHSLGHLHRDVKPSNVLVTPEGRVVLLDFGLVHEHYLEPRETDPKAVGTAAYMAPEQARGDPLDPASDWYSVGAVLYESLCGRVPFEGPALQVMLDKQRHDPLPPTAFGGVLPADLCVLSMALLSRPPRVRPSGSELLSRLRAAAAGQARPDAVAEPPRSGGFWGRMTELTLLERVFLEHGSETADSPRAVLIHGPSGIGKTALVEHFVERTQAVSSAPVSVLRGRCRQYEDVSFKAFDELFDALSGQLADQPGLDGLQTEEVCALRRAFPVLERVPRLSRAQHLDPAMADPKQLRVALYAAARKLFALLARSRPLIVVLEDLHWADADSWALLHELLREPDPLPGMLIMTARSELLAFESERRDVYEVLHASGVHPLALDPFDPREASRFVRLLLAREGHEEDSLVEQIVQQASGHPLFLATLAHHVSNVGRPSGPVCWSDVVWEQIEPLAPPARDLLVVVSLMGGPGERRVLAEATGVDPGRLAEWSDRLIATRLLRVTGSRRSALEPHHDQIRQAVLERLPDAERVHWHRRIAHAIEACDPIADDAVFHYFRAGDLALASSSARRAAGRAMRALAFDRAVRMLRQSLDWTDDEPTRIVLTEHLADALSHAGRSLEAAEAYLHASTFLAGEACHALRRMAAVHLLTGGEIVRGKALLAEELAQLDIGMPTSTLRALMHALVYRARLSLRGTRHRIDPDCVLSPSDRARLELCGAAAFVLSTVDPMLGSCFGTLYTLLALPSGDREHTARALHVEGSYLGLIGNPRRGALLRSQARQVAGSSPSPYLSASMAAYDSAVYWANSDYRSALRSARAAHREFSTRCKRISYELVSLELVETNALFWLGRYPELARRAGVCLRAAEERGDRYGITNMLVSQASVRFLVQDDMREAESSIARGIANWDTGSFDMQHLMALQSRAYVSLYRGEPEPALARFMQARAALARSLLLRLPTYRVLVWQLEAQLRLAVAEQLAPDAARPHLERVRGLVTKLRRADVPLGPALAGMTGIAWQGHVDAAVDLDALHGALAALEELGLAGHAAALRLRVAMRADRPPSEAHALRSAALRHMTEQGVKRPEWFVRVLCPSVGAARGARALPSGA